MGDKIYSSYIADNLNTKYSLHRMNILIVEDEIIISESLKMMLAKLGHHVTGTCMDYQDFELLVQETTPDLVVMDINLQQEKDGIFLAEICQNRGLPFVFITSYSDAETIGRAMKYDPLGYILKPFTERELQKTLEIVKAKTNVLSDDNIYLKDGHEYVKLRLDNVLWLNAENVYTVIHTAEKKILYRSSLSDMMKLLPTDQFLRVHRSYAVNLKKIDKVSQDHIMINSDKIPMSRTHKAELLEKIG